MRVCTWRMTDNTNDQKKDIQNNTQKTKDLFKKVNFEIRISLKHLVFFMENQNILNLYILAILCYSICKSYYVPGIRDRGIQFICKWTRLYVCTQIFSSVLSKYIQAGFIPCGKVVNSEMFQIVPSFSIAG